MSNLSKRRRTDFTGNQRLNKEINRFRLFGELLNKTWDKKLSEVLNSGFTASTGAEDMKR